MRIRWANILGILVAVAAVIALWRHGEDLMNFFGAIGSIGPRHSPDVQFKGLVALTIVAIAAVVLARLIGAMAKRGE